MIDDALASGVVSVPARPGPTTACSDGEVLTIALVRHLLGRPSDSAFQTDVQADWSHDFPHLPTQSEFNRRVRWLWGAFEELRQPVMGPRIEDPWQHGDTTARSVTYPRRMRGPDGWDGPGTLHAGFGWDGAHREWSYGFRLALRTALSSRLEPDPGRRQ